MSTEKDIIETYANKTIGNPLDLGKTPVMLEDERQIDLDEAVMTVASGIKSYQPQSHYYFTPHLQILLSQIPEHPVTVIEAPSGFGKTTAVREYLHHACDDGCYEYWYTCLAEPIEKAWNGFCLTLSHIDSHTAHYLRRLGIPTEENLSDMANAMRHLKSNLKTYLVIDNFQFMQPELPLYIIDALANHESPNLHIIFITQKPDLSNNRTVQNNRIHHIDRRDLCFTEKDIDTYLRKWNIHLNEEELSSLQHQTEGWIAALNLQRLHFEQTGGFEQTEGIDALIESAIWNRLDEKEQEFLIAISLFDSFSAEQARIMLNSQRLPAYASKLLNTNAFIRFDSAEKTYILHSLFRDFLSQEFDKLTGQAKKETWSLAGKAYTAQGMNYLALCCYQRTNDFHALLSLPLRGDECTDYLNAGSAAVFNSIVSDCPEDVLMQYPQMLLVIAFELYMMGGGEAFEKVCRLIKTLLEQPKLNQFDDKDYRVIAGEFARLESFIAFNDIEKMSQKHREALELLDGPSTLYDWNDAWTFGQPSVLFLFWSKSGKLQNELQSMDVCLPYYSELTRGHGTGAAEAMRAESLLLSGRDIEAESLCHKALYKASAQDQDSICYAAELSLARIALLRGDTSSFKETQDNIQRKVLEGTELGGAKIAELALSFLELKQGSPDIAVWLTDLERIRKNLYPIAGMFAILVHLEYLLIQKEYARVLGLSEALMDEVAKYRFELPHLYLLIYKAIALLELDQKDEALRVLHSSFDLALPDNILLPFAEHGEKLRPLLIQSKVREGVEEVLALIKRQTTGVRTIRPSLAGKNELTSREKEVAYLAAKGLTNKQIAQHLFVSVDTVKTLLKRIFVKMEIRSRAQLQDRLF